MTVLDERRKTVGQLFAVGFHGTELDDNIRSLVCDYHVGAVVLFKRNVRDAAQLRALCLSLQQLAKEAGHGQPLFVGIDQENGLVTRISPPVASQMPGPMALAAAGSLASVRAVAEATGSMLRHFGININYAPVGDVNSEPLNPVIGVRSPGDDPVRVSQSAAACAAGLRASGVVPCIKHFPGHGDTRVDSHYGLPVIRKSRQALEATELVPFRHAVAHAIEMVMTAHISLPELEGGSDLPATLSPEAMEILRDDLEFQGVVMTDCMEMDGVRATYGTVEGSLMALQAGVDNVMICHTFQVQTAAIDRVCQALEHGEISPQRIEASLRRLSELKSRFISWDDALQPQAPEGLSAMNKGSEELAKQVYRDATTLVRSQAGLLPLSRTAKTVFISPGPNVPLGGAVHSGDVAPPTRVPWVSGSFGDVLRAHNPTVVDIRFVDSTLSEDEWRQVDKAEVVILATRNARESQYQAQLGMEVARRRGEAPLATVATCNPYDFLECPDMRTYLAIYEPTVEAFSAAAHVLYGKVSAGGKLPVSYIPPRK
ncbi:beta-hexosaminidase A [Hirsutella rhossiliensis]|uniref:Beta-hexosaminidase A n=1 Tax=Hirsutella rhossiliensis TaxID=111463 RepID=A0A9P8MQX7_9HYPO|nr:beta-hexosaminidase A [Hirsutella rhossiliensis]KAH0957597.1 beta-hexosaminidase A [Hirsutella rhossiliensis]